MAKERRGPTRADDLEIPGLLRHPLKPADVPDVAGELSTPQSGSVVEEHEAHGAAAEQPETTGLYLYGVVRARLWRGLARQDRALQRVRYRDLEALVRPSTFQLPEDEQRTIAEHQQVVESVMQRVTVLPAPFGIIFKGKRPLLRMLQDQYLALDEGLSLLDGHWELRLHISAAGVGDLDALSDEAMDVYSDLRPYARAAVPFPSEESRLMSAAFLVDRASWVEFVERIEDYGRHHEALSFDVTGPWPAYDFVRIVT